MTRRRPARGRRLVVRLRVGLGMWLRVRLPVRVGGRVAMWLGMRLAVWLHVGLLVRLAVRLDVRLHVGLGVRLFVLVRGMSLRGVGFWLPLGIRLSMGFFGFCVAFPF